MRIPTQPYLEWLKQMNADLLEYERLGLEEAEKEFVHSIKDQSRTVGIVPAELLPDRPWLKEPAAQATMLEAAAAGFEAPATLPPTSNLTLRGKKVGLLEVASAVESSEGSSAAESVDLLPEVTEGFKALTLKRKPATDA